MSKISKLFLEVIIPSLLIGMFITVLSFFHERIVALPTCGPTADCALQDSYHGFPLAYVIDPDYRANHGLQPVKLISDIAIWSAVSAAIILLIGRIKYD